MKQISVKNINHPVNMRDARGQRAKEEARKLSNKELDELLETNIPDAGDLEAILTWARGQKIKFIARCAKDNFVKAWNKAEKEAEKEAEKANELQPTKAEE